MSERVEEAPVDTQRIASPGVSYVSMKSNNSIGLPPDLRDGPAATSDPVETGVQMESDMQYALIKVPQDNTVHVVPSNWLDETEEGIYCYWPIKNFIAKAKRRDTPETFWSKHVAVVLEYEDSYEEARQRASNLESDEESPWRPVRPPAKHRRQLDSADVAEDVPASARETSSYNTELKKHERVMSIRLDKMEQRLSAIEALLRSIAQPSDNSEFLLNPCQSTQELEDLCLRMKDSEYRKKTVHYLSLLGGRTPGESIRRLLRTVGLNGVWSQYSMKGKRGKKKFQDLDICSVIIQVCKKMHPNVQVKVFEEYIAETLKYAPHRDSKTEYEETGPASVAPPHTHIPTD